MADAVVGLDLGGTKLSAAVLHDGGLGEPHVVPTDKSSEEALIAQIEAAAREAGKGLEIAAVGIGIPSVVDWETGAARASVNVPLAGVPLRQVLRDRLGIPVFVDNDATCAAFGEAHDEQGRLLHANLVMFTVGTGVGGGLVLGGQLYRGATGAAAEMGHTLVAVDLSEHAPEPSSFPQPGSLESLAAGRALDGLARRAAQRFPDSALGRLTATGKEVAGPDAVVAAQEGDEVAIRLLRQLGERLGIGIANAINLFDPEVVAIGGGVSRAGDLLLEPARETALGFVVPGVGTRTEIRLARHGTGAGLLGAALMARTELERHKETR
jgi:glucokinase